MVETQAGVKRMLRLLVGSIVKEFNGADAEYALKELVPTLLPALVDLLKAQEARKARVERDADGCLRLRPMNHLASFLYRNNPRKGHGSAKVAAHRGLIEEVVLEEKKGVQHRRFQRRLASNAESEMIGLAVWPMEAPERPDACASLGSATLHDLLDELEACSGLVGLRSEVRTILEAVDVRRSGMVLWSDLVLIVQHLVGENREPNRIKVTVAFNRWLCTLVKAKIQAALADYHGSEAAGDLFIIARLDTRRPEEGWDGCARFMKEVKDHVLSWDQHDAERFDVEDILDACEMKCASEAAVTEADFEHILDRFLDRLARARVGFFFRLL